MEDTSLGGDVVSIDLNRPMPVVLEELSRCPVKTRLSLTGTLVVARDIAHAKLQERLASGGGMPDYMKNHAVYYAWPAKTPDGMASGSFGPTTAGRMDSYVDEFQARLHHELRHGRLHGRSHGRVHRWLHGRSHGRFCTDGCTDGSTDGCT